MITFQEFPGYGSSSSRRATRILEAPLGARSRDRDSTSTFNRSKYGGDLRWLRKRVFNRRKVLPQLWARPTCSVGGVHRLKFKRCIAYDWPAGQERGPGWGCRRVDSSSLAGAAVSRVAALPALP